MTAPETKEEGAITHRGAPLKTRAAGEGGFAAGSAV